MIGLIMHHRSMIARPEIASASQGSIWATGIESYDDRIMMIARTPRD